MPERLPSLMKERILVPKDTFCSARDNSEARPGIGFMTWTPSLLAGKALVNLKERDHALHGPDVRHRALAGDVTIHGVFEQDGAKDGDHR